MSDQGKWKKWPIGKFRGYTVYIELPPTLSGRETEREWNDAANYFEQSFRSHDFLNEMRDFLIKPTLDIYDLL